MAVLPLAGDDQVTVRTGRRQETGGPPTAGPSATGPRDGAAAGGPLPEPTSGWIHRDFTGGTATPLASGRGYAEEPLIAVLTSYLSGRMADVQAGQALQRVLLAATADGLAASFLSQIVEVPETREELRHLIRASLPPHAVLRIGRGWPVPATPRRRIVDLLGPQPAPQPEPAR